MKNKIDTLILVLDTLILVAAKLKEFIKQLCGEQYARSIQKVCNVRVFVSCY